MRKGILLAVGLAAAGLVAAVALFSGGSKVAESTPQSVVTEVTAPSRPTVALAPAGSLDEPAPGPIDAQQASIATDARSEVAAPLIRGRVIEADSGNAWPGIQLQLIERSEVIASASSDAAGHFELPFSQSDRLSVVLVEPEGWKAERRRQSIPDSGPSNQELVFELRRDARVVFNGRAVDEKSGEPLPYLKVSVGSDFSGTGVETDADGLFTSRQRYDAGEVGVALIAANGARLMNSERTIDFDGTGRIHDVPLPIGPSYDLQVSAPAGYELADLRAFLAHDLETCPWTLTRDLREGELLHPSAPPWVRFTEFDKYATKSDVTLLWICTKDGRWLGSCQVAKLSNRGEGIHDIALALCGELEIDLSAAGSPLDARALAKLHGPRGEDCGGSYAESGSHVHFVRIPSGEYLLSIESTWTKPIERMVRVAGGAPTFISLALEPLPHGGSIRGFVRSESGRYKATDTVALRPVGQDSDAFSAGVEWSEEAGTLVGQFVFGDVPAGEYELSAWSLSPFPWRASPWTVVPPATDVELLCLDGAGGVMLEIEAFDAQTGKPVGGLSVSFGEDGEHEWFSYSRDGANRVELGRIPRESGLKWEVKSEGYLLAAGDISSFKPVGTKEGEPLLRARVELQMGWGGRVLAYTESERIAGAVVLCDDIEVGRTNESGEVDIVLPARPKRFEVRHPGFDMANPETGEVPEDGAVLFVYMTARK
jgi:hypothetical protein